MQETKVHFDPVIARSQGLYQDGNTGMGRCHYASASVVWWRYVQSRWWRPLSRPIQERDLPRCDSISEARATAPAAIAQGIGEQTDVAAAVTFLKSRGSQHVHLSGYSFGTWVNAMAVTGGPDRRGHDHGGPAVAFMDFGNGIRLPQLFFVVAGGRDEFGPPKLIRRAIDHWNPDARLEVLPDADHFFFGYLDEVTQKLVDSI